MTACEKGNIRPGGTPGRREFFRQVLRAAWGSFLMLSLGRFGRPGSARASAGADLAAVKGRADEAARRAVELIGGMGRFVKKGQTVVVKPNIGWDRTPEQAANTNPEVVAAVVSMALEAGAAEVLVFDRTCNDPRLCYRRSGIEDAVKGVGDGRAKIMHIDRRKFVDVPVPGGAALTSWPIYEAAHGADVYVNVPVAKHHSLSDLTMGLKNVMGVIGGNRGQIHTGFEDKIVDLNLARPADLTVLDATRILTAHGPQGGRLEDVKQVDTVVAGADVVAVDAYTTRFFGLEPGDIDHVRRAHERGLGTMEIAALTVREETLP
jgi:uncharacterized protein (DUF362 family)